ncbi:MAG: hypothetical protein D6761_05400, partial [Candidatus Dadabacteria bacterium]
IAEDLSFLNPISSTADCTSFPYLYELANQSDGTHDIYLRFYDDLDNPGPITQATIVLDTQEPSGASLIPVDGGYATTNAVTFDLVAVGADLAQVGPGSVCAGQPVFPFVPSTTITLPPGDGAKTVAWRYGDTAGNISPCATVQVTVDTMLPNGVMTIQGSISVSATTTNTVNLVFSSVDTDVESVALSNFATLADASYQPFTTVVPWVLSSGDGQKTVYARFRDRAGNESPVTWATISLDTTPPLNPFVLIQDDNGVTRGPTIDVQVNAVDAAQMRIATSPSALLSASWTTYAVAATVDLAGEPDGTVVVYAQFRDIYGNASAMVNDTIDLDRVPPTPVTVQVLDGPYVSDVSVLLQLAVSDPGPVTMIVSNDQTFNEAVQSFAPNITHLLAPGDGAKRVYVRFFDAAGNAADIASSMVTLDTTPPSVPQIRTVAQIVDADQITVEIFPNSGTDANFAAFEVLGGSLYTQGFTAVSWSSATTQFVFGLLQDADNLLQVRVRDRAGNTSAPGQVIITEDSTRPSPLTSIRVRNQNGKVTLYWEPSSEGDVVGYWVYYGTTTRLDPINGQAGAYQGQFADQGDSPVWVAGRQSDSFTLSGLPNGTVIYATVVPVDHAGKEAVYGNEVAGHPNLITPEHKFPELRQLSVLSDIGFTSEIRRYQNYLYVVANNRIDVWDLSDALRPSHVRAVTVPVDDARLTTLTFHPAQPRMYVLEFDPAPTDTGLQPAIAVFDLTSPGAPSWLGSVTIPTEQRLPVNLVASNSALYVSALDTTQIIGGSHELAVLSLADPDQPVPDTAASMVTSSLFFEMAVDPVRNELYMSDLGIGIRKYDISGPGAPVFVTRTAPGAHFGIGDFVLYGDFLYASPYGNSLELFDLRNGGIDATGYSYTLTAYNGSFYQSADVFGNSEPGSMLQIIGNQLFSAGDEGVGWFDLSVTDNIAELGSFVDFGGQFEYAAIAATSTPGHTIYGFDEYELTIFDMDNQRIYSRLGIRRPYKDLDVMYGLIAVAEGKDGVAIYDYSGGVTKELSRVTYGACNFEKVQWVQQEGYRMIYAYSAQPSGLVSIDATDPYNPVALSELGGCPSSPTSDWFYYSNSYGPFAVSDSTIYLPYWTTSGSTIVLYRLFMDQAGAPNNLAYGSFCRISNTDVELPIRDVFVHDDKIFIMHGTGTASQTEIYSTAGNFGGAACTRIGEMNRGDWDSRVVVGQELYYKRGSQISRYAITDPTNWQALGTSIDLGSGYLAGGLVYEGGLLYTFVDDGVMVIDDSGFGGQIVGLGPDPYGGNNFREAQDLAVERNWSIGLTKDRGINLWQIATPRRLQAQGDAAPLVSSLRALAPVGPFVALAGSFSDALATDGFAIYDARGVTQFSPVTWIASLDNFLGDDVRRPEGLSGGEQSFVGVTSSASFVGVYRFDLTDPTAPSWSMAATTGSMSRVAVDGDRVYVVTDWANGDVAVFDLSGSAGVQTLPVVNLGVRIAELEVQGGIAYVLEDDPVSTANPNIHVYRVSGDVWNYVDTIVGTNFGSPLLHGRYLMISDRPSGVFQQDLKFYDLERIFSGAGSPVIVGSSPGKWVTRFSRTAGTDIFNACCDWLAYTDPNTVTTQFSTNGVDISEMSVSGPFIFGMDWTGQLQRFAFE